MTSRWKGEWRSRGGPSFCQLLRDAVRRGLPWPLPWPCPSPAPAAAWEELNLGQHLGFPLHLKWLPLPLILPSLCSTWWGVRPSIRRNICSKTPGGRGRAGPGQIPLGEASAGGELQPFQALCRRGPHMHVYGRGSLPPFTKLVFSRLTREQVQHHWLREANQRQVQWGQCSHLSAYPEGCGPLSRTFSAWGPCLDPAAPALRDSPASAAEASLARPARTGFGFMPVACLSPKSLIF